MYVVPPMALAKRPYEPPWTVERYVLKLMTLTAVGPFQDSDTVCCTGVGEVMLRTTVIVFVVPPPVNVTCPV